MLVSFLENHISKLNVDDEILSILNSNNINNIKELWNLKRKDLKRMDLTDNQINQIVIKMQLKGIDLNRRVYNKY